MNSELTWDLISPAQIFAFSNAIQEIVIYDLEIQYNKIMTFTLINGDQTKSRRPILSIEYECP